jgi:hypothetical protein
MTVHLTLVVVGLTIVVGAMIGWNEEAASEVDPETKPLHGVRE